ncbi:MAG: patatin-like phospholipase family protein, partial [Polyangiales bacterium]
MTTNRRDVAVPDLKTGLVLSGGGARGAYEAGVLAAVFDVLRRAGRLERAPFQICCGTSVGAIHAAYLGARSHCPREGLHALEHTWTGLRLHRFLRMDPVGLMAPSKLRVRLRRTDGSTGALLARAVLNPAPLDALIRSSISWAQLRQNIDEGRIIALMIAALQVRSGRTTIFSDLAPGVSLPPSVDRRREVVHAKLTADHVLASAALPGLFPTRKIGDSYYCDGGVRFNTPIAPALRAGADRLLVIPLLGGQPDKSPPATEESPSLFFLFGKLLNALLLDPVNYDLAVLERFNRLLATMERILDPDQVAAMQRVMSETRGVPYRRVETLVFRPSKDIGVLAH